MAVYAMIGFAGFGFISGGIVDYSSLINQNRALQEAADAAAVSAAQELMLVGASSRQRVASIAESYVAANYPDEVETDVKVTDGGKVVEVSLKAPPKVYFAGPVAQNAGAVNAFARAELLGDSANVCVITLEPDKNAAFSLDSNATLHAPKCAVYSNSTHAKGLSSLSNAELVANMICSAGGKAGSGKNFSPTPTTDCPPVPDPLAGRAPPPVGSCDHNNLKVKDTVKTLLPGVYCGGLDIDGNALVTLLPGVYVIKDGQLKVDSNAVVVGVHVGFYFTGINATFAFKSNADISLSAPKIGPMAGMLFQEDPASPVGRPFSITTNNARYLVGTIYLPNGRFVIDSDQNVADNSEFTVVVVRMLELKSGPRLVLNTDYALIDVPVPAGVGPSASKSAVRLVGVGMPPPA